MIKSVTVENPSGESLKMELSNPDPSGLIITDVQGIGPVNAEVSITELASSDGAVINSARQTKRNIVLYLRMMFSPTIEDARQKTYYYFPNKKMVKITIETDNRTVYTYGIVEYNEPNIFSEEEGTQISIICGDPFFHDINISSFGFYGIHPLFEFPFENDFGKENLEFGELRFDTRLVLDYDGDADTGVEIHLKTEKKVGNVSIYNAMTRETMTIDMAQIKNITGSDFMPGDEIVISTVVGNKWARIIRNGQYKSIIGAIGKNPVWFQISHGENIFGFFCQNEEDSEENLHLEMIYNNCYNGV